MRSVVNPPAHPVGLSRRPRSFTLVELMVVIAIIGLLAAVVTVNVIGQMDDARKTRVAADMKQLLNACKMFRSKAGYYPQQMQDLMQQPGNWRAGTYRPFLEEEPRDPWGNRYQMEARGGREPKIICFGSDGQPGGVEDAADIDSDTVGREGQN